MQLYSCPFCGSDDVKIARTQVDSYGINTGGRYYAGKCHKCGARAGVAFAGYNGLTQTTTTDEQAKRLAAAKWNRREANS